MPQLSLDHVQPAQLDVEPCARQIAPADLDAGADDEIDFVLARLNRLHAAQRSK